MTHSLGDQAWMVHSMLSPQSILCRTIFAPVASAMTCVVAVLSAFTNLRWLLGCAMAFGFVFGWHWSLMPVRSALPSATVTSISTFASREYISHTTKTAARVQRA